MYFLMDVTKENAKIPQIDERNCHSENMVVFMFESSFSSGHLDCFFLEIVCAKRNWCGSKPVTGTDDLLGNHEPCISITSPNLHP